MSITAQTIYNAALALIDERTTSEFEGRAPALINTLIGRCFNASEEYETGPHSTWEPISALTDYVEGIDQTLCLSAMPYGLAALLALDYDPVKSRSLWSVFLEQVELCRRSPAEFEPIENSYGGIEYGQFGRW